MSVNVLVIIHSRTHYRLLLPYIQYLKDNQFKCHFILIRSELDEYRNSLAEMGEITVMYKIKNISINEAGKNKPSFKNKLKWLALLKNIFKQGKKMREIIHAFDPTHIILSSDRYLDISLNFAKYALKNKLPSLVVGVDYFYIEDLSGYYHSNPQRKMDTFFKKMIAKLYKNQVFETNQGLCLFYSPMETIVLSVLNLLPSKPVYPGLSFASQIHVDCQATKEILLQKGGEEDQILIAGNSEEIKIKPDQKKDKIILALPQGWEHHLVSKEEHFKITEFICEQFTQAFGRIFVSLHPKMNREHYQYLEEKYPLQIAKENLSEIICEAKMFAATYSSTVLWAIKLGTPVILFDLYQLNYKSFESIAGVIKLTGNAEVQKFLEKIKQDPNIELEMRNEMHKSAKLFQSEYQAIKLFKEKFLKVG